MLSIYAKCLVGCMRKKVWLWLRGCDSPVHIRVAAEAVANTVAREWTSFLDLARANECSLMNRWSGNRHRQYFTQCVESEGPIKPYTPIEPYTLLQMRANVAERHACAARSRYATVCWNIFSAPLIIVYTSIARTKWNIFRTYLKSNNLIKLISDSWTDLKCQIFGKQEYSSSILL